MWQLTVALLLSACLSVMAFKAMPQAFRASSHLNERFNLDFGMFSLHSTHFLDLQNIQFPLKSCHTS